jgi:hypothetical protein
MRAPSHYARTPAGCRARVLACVMAVACASTRADDEDSTSIDDAATMSSRGSSDDPSTGGIDESDDVEGTSDAATSDATSSGAPTTDPGDATGDDALAGCFHTWTFDDCSADWEVGAADPSAPTPPGWECGEPPTEISVGGAHTGVWATSLGGEYTEDQSSYLASPSFSLADCAGATVYLSFAHLYEFGSGDGGLVQTSTDGGASWTTIAPVWHGYCSGTLDSPWSPPGGEPGFCGGDKDAWIHSLVELDAYSGEADVRVRFVFGSDGIIEQAGWYIDSVRTEAY